MRDGATTSTRDGTIDGIAAAGCIDPGDGDPFTSGVPCSSWGTMVAMQTAVTESQGALVAVPTPTVANARGGCTRSQAPLTDAGVFVEIGGALSNGDTELSATGFAITIASSAMLVLSEASSTTMLPYDPVAMRWLRLRPAGGRIAYEYSPDGQHWTIARISTAPAPAVADLAIDARTPTSNVLPGVAQFEGINVCP